MSKRRGPLRLTAAPWQGYFCGRPLPITELLEYLVEPTDPSDWLTAGGDSLGDGRRVGT
jgi:hypothetical protein